MPKRSIETGTIVCHLLFDAEVDVEVDFDQTEYKPQ